MGVEFGKPPSANWAAMAPELLVTDIHLSTAFWCDVLGFTVAYHRPEQNFVYLQRPEGTQLMLCQRSGAWETGPLDSPFGRGVMFQIYVESLGAIEEVIAACELRLYAGPRQVWRRTGDRESGSKEIFVQDPDGYLVMMAQRLGERAPFDETQA